MGIGAGAVVWASAAMFGLNLPLRRRPALLWALKPGGAAYLIWMALHLWRDAQTPLVTEDARPVPRSGLSAFRFGLFTQLG
ncbi:MAG: LysE family transporter [Paracoccaceae bacterium]